MVERYVDAVCAEIGSFATSGCDIEIDTIYFGGGTPSLLSPLQVERLLNAVRTKFKTYVNPEITMEMNPATVTPESLAAFRDLGVSRASFGVQTFNDRDLKVLARGHDAKDARDTFRMLREVGYDNVSLDLIAGLPGQTLGDWERNLDEALVMRPEHLSLYLLEVHEATPLAEQIRSRRQPVPDDDLAAEMYELMLDKTVAAGYEQYEISNFARPAFASRHNTKYWRLDPVYAFGVSAHSFDGRQRYANERDTAKYVERIETMGTAEVMREEIDHASEFAFLGLRLNAGIDMGEFEQRFGKLSNEQINPHLNAGLIEVSDGRLRLTRQGMLFSNEVFEKFL